MHGKVKLARSLETGDYVAIKIIQRFSKKRRLGRVTVSPEDKTKREIAILKKIRHANVVGLLEVIDDPEFKKIYMVLEHVELGEIVWRKKGVPQICAFERRRVEREQRGDTDTGEDEKFFKIQERRRQRKEFQRAKVAQLQIGQGDYWSLEHGDDVDSEGAPLSRHVTNTSERAARRGIMHSNPTSRSQSRATSRAPSRTSSRAPTPLLESEIHDIPSLDSDNEDDPQLPLGYGSNHSSTSALEGTYYGSYPDDPPNRGRAPSMADSIISHMSSIDDIPHDPREEDYSYVPCFTIDQARSAFRDTVLGLEYLHYEGVVHRDIKPANLLWTKDHRVKISDFGVSYFGRPIRPGEAEENISEADATDFDDDLELAKTVGTPAFFAPELCYTDIDIEQPKVTEQIDVWSLGVTLYCLIYARLPFLADDEFQLFKSIAKDDVYIPRRRLKAVDPSCPPTSRTRIGPSTGPYREEGELAFEDIDAELHDLLKRMLIKDPLERIRLREIKRHPWVVAGIENKLGWIDDTDPSRKTAGRRIQVDRSELDHAVVPITFLERARSALKKTVSKVIGAARSEGSRRRAVSSATTSPYDDMHTPITPASRDGRRTSLRGDEAYFAPTNDIYGHRELTEHPLAQSQTASPDMSLSEDPFSLDFIHPSVRATPKRVASRASTDFNTRPGPPERMVSTTASIQTVVPRGHSHSRSVTVDPSGILHEEDPSTPGPFTDHKGNILGGDQWREPDFIRALEEARSKGAKSVDRFVFNSDSKRAEASVAVSNAVAPGHFEHSTPLHHPRPTRVSGVSPTNVHGDQSLPSPLFFQPYLVQQHQMAQSSSTPDVPRTYVASNLDERPATANRTPEAKSPPRRVQINTPETFAPAKQEQERKKKLEAEADRQRRDLALIKTTSTAPGEGDCPPSPDDDLSMRKQEESRRAQSSSSVASNSIASQVTSPSDLTSPLSSVNLSGQDHDHAFTFPSVPSLPALVSSGSSVCADPEGDFLQHPGVVSPPTSIIKRAHPDSTPETLTPPTSLSKQVSHSPPHSPSHSRPSSPEPHTIALDGQEQDEDEGYNGDGDTLPLESDPDSDSDSDSDSDEGLTMTGRKPVAKITVARRGTNASVGSTDTARIVGRDGP